MDSFFFKFPCQTSSIQYFSQEKFEFLHRYHRSQCKECFRKVILQTAEKTKLSKKQVEEIMLSLK